MHRIVTASEMREIDQRTIKEACMPGLLLMENAGLGLVQVIMDHLNEAKDARVIILCGKGNNGGDGMVVARHLYNRGVHVDVYLAGVSKNLKGDALLNFKILKGYGIDVIELKSVRTLKKNNHIHLIVDALLGTGISGEVKGLTGDVIRWVNRTGVPVISVDLPSGLQCDDGQYTGDCIQADHTVTMAAMKRGLLLPPGRELAGHVSVVDIGVPDFIAESVDSKVYLIESADVAIRLPDRPAAAHKGTFGRLAILAGSRGMTGAGVLCSQASLRIGAGLTILGVPESLNPVFEEKLTEVMTKPLPETNEGSLSAKGSREIEKLLDWADLLALGPGLSMNTETSSLIRKVVLDCSLPLILDADGINAFAGQPQLLEKRKGTIVLTPHYGELSRLTGQSIEEISVNRIEVARREAIRFKSVLILKGSPTVIAAPNGEVFINPTGNSGMATAGSGDVLTGMIAGLMAQGCSPLDSAICGVYLHGMAGDLAAQDYGQHSLIAGDIIDYISEAVLGLEHPA